MKIKYWKGNVNYGIVAFILVISICFATLFLRPIIGMADNGDFFRVLIQNDLHHLADNEHDKLLGYFNKDYGIFKYNNENEKTIESTQFILIKAAVSIDKFFTKDYVFDVRFLSFIYVITLAFASYLLVKVLTKDLKSHKYKMILTVLFVFIFCDTGYVAYFNSFFGEAVNLSFFLLSIAILLYMYKFEKYNVLNLIMFFLSSFIFVGSKQQLAPIGILIAIVLFRLFVINKNKVFRYTSLVLSIGIIASSMHFYGAISGEFDYINRYHSMTRGILLYESNSDEIVKEFNMNTQYSLLQESIYFNKIPVIDPADKKLKEEFYSKYSVFGVLTFYMTHPKIFVKMINYAVINGYSIRPKVMGNYEKREGKTYGKQSNFFSLWSTIKEKYMPHNLFLTILLAGIYFGYSIKRYINARKTGDITCQLCEETFLYIFLVGVSQIFVSIIGAGDADLGKHVFMFNVAFDIMLIYSTMLIIKNIYEKKITKV